MSITNLPNELLAKISKDLPPSSALKLRITNKLFNGIVDTHHTDINTKLKQGPVYIRHRDTFNDFFKNAEIKNKVQNNTLTIYRKMGFSELPKVSVSAIDQAHTDIIALISIALELENFSTYRVFLIDLLTEFISFCQRIKYKEKNLKLLINLKGSLSVGNNNS
ncbi:F-box protein [Marinibactrum halimedae]|uniref:F-box domain-containing protein n=1 Tax=Marinibactrum halimedae TaxID=1444977 RepID=A0AA37T3D9_9GAMM|nr:F-box protein [Marinibactrum halimedae]MCD9460989.1 F-box protein [Marinibactrum halimedae]GLS24781.1 hypothetical protein GCM10007877_04950 [Marinibactrum halimedae]